ncbi:MAG: methylenetetrahydrofolate reductase [Deltaproteobacteria bacterium]|nr:methylenetetrahydrofolate reductase [Deltaproteobacteria bacterium]
MTSDSHLEKVLEKGEFAVTSECGPPRGADPTVITKKGELIKESVDAINVTDNQTSMVRMSSLSSCILCLSGDHQKFGDHAVAKNVYDMDSIHLIQTVKHMRDEGKFLGGDELKGVPRFFIGAAANPFADPFEIRVSRLAKKVAAGAQFIQTQCIFNLDRFKKWMELVRERGLHEKVHILGGVTPMKSVGMAKYMKKMVPGMDVPDELIDRIKGVEKEKRAEEGIKIAIETIQQLKEIEGMHGVHIMAIEWEEMVPEIAKEAGLLPRPQVD